MKVSRVLHTLLLITLIIISSGPWINGFHPARASTTPNLGEPQPKTGNNDSNGPTVAAQASQDTTKNPTWNFLRPQDWASFARVDKDSADLVVGVNPSSPNANTKIINLVTQWGGSLRYNIHLGGRTAALVADLPFSSIAGFTAELHRQSLSSYIEPNFIYKVELTPNDPFWGQQWGPQKIQADWAWNTTLGKRDILVATVDTGIDWDHPDLVGNYARTANGTHIGLDWVNRDLDPMDDNGHGTHVAGIIAATTNNAIGIAGLAQVRFFAEKAFDLGGFGSEAEIAQALAHGADQGARIINNSWGGSIDSALIREAVLYAHGKGVLLVAAAGNCACNQKLYPAAYPEVIAVTATDRFDQPAFFTSFGDWVELSAPGHEVLSTIWNNAYASLSGTSMATPHVVGVAALILSAHGSLTRDQVRLHLRLSSDDLGQPGFDPFFGHGRINARTAVETSLPQHELVLARLDGPPVLEPGQTGIFPATIVNFALNPESNVVIRLFSNTTQVSSVTLSEIQSGATATVQLTWTTAAATGPGRRQRGTEQAFYLMKASVDPVSGESNVKNNDAEVRIFVGFPIRAAVLDSAGTDLDTTAWTALNMEWPSLGSKPILVDFTSLNKENITYEDLVGSRADVLILSCACSAFLGWEFTDSEIAAVSRYVEEGHGLIGTAGTLFSDVPNNSKLAPMWGVRQETSWDVVGTDLVDILDRTQQLFLNIPDPFILPFGPTSIPSDFRWDETELTDGIYIALGFFNEAAVIVRRGLFYISFWPEIFPPRYFFNLQLLYNAIISSRFIKPEHDIATRLEVPSLLKPGQLTIINATAANVGLSDESSVTLELLINGTTVASSTFKTIPSNTTSTIRFTWTPTTEGVYIITARVPAIPNEEVLTNNIVSKNVFVGIPRFVLWDDGHDQDGDSILSNYSTLKELLLSRGIILEEKIDPITLELLSRFDILAIVDPETNFTLDEIFAINTFVASGGSLIVIADTGYPPSLNSILLPYGVLLTGMTAFSGGPTTNIIPHPITQDVGSIFYDLAWEISVTEPSSVLARTLEGLGFLSATEGFNRVAVFSDSNPWDNDHIKLADNTRLALNAFRWLGFKPEHELVVSLNVPLSVEPFTTTSITASVLNVGTMSEINVQLEILINGTVAASAIYPELPRRSGQSLNYSWTPTVEGIYFVTAQAMPVPNESDTQNNVVIKSVRVILPKVILSYVQFTDYFWEYRNTLRAIDLTYGKAYRIMELWDYSLIDPSIQDADILLIPEQEFAPSGDTLTRIGVFWGATLVEFLQRGGVIIVLDFNFGSGGTFQILTGAGLMSISGGSFTTGSTIRLIDPIDPLARGVSSSFSGPNGSVSFITSEPRTVFDDGRYPIVIHKTVSRGHIALLGFDYFSSNHETEQVLGNAIPLHIRPEHQLRVRVKAPASLTSGDSEMIEAVVENRGSKAESSVSFTVSVDGTPVASSLIGVLTLGESETVTYFWSPTTTVDRPFTVTANAVPVPGEEIVEDNTRSTTVLVFANKKPVAIVSYSPSDPFEKEQVTFDASGSYDIDGFIISYEWSLGDGATATGSIVSHSYEKTGSYTIKLTLRDNKEDVTIFEIPVPVSPEPPVSAELAQWKARPGTKHLDLSKQSDQTLQAMVKNTGPVTAYVQVRYAIVGLDGSAFIITTESVILAQGDSIEVNTVWTPSLVAMRYHVTAVVGFSANPARLGWTLGNSATFSFAVVL